MPTQTAGLNKLGTTPEQQQHRRAFESGEEKTQTHKQTTKQNKESPHLYTFSVMKSFRKS